MNSEDAGKVSRFAAQESGVSVEWAKFLREHPTRGGLAERSIFTAGFESGAAFVQGSPATPQLDDLQDKVSTWGAACFGAEHMADHKVRALRLLEEAIEFAQSVEAPMEQCAKLVEYVYSRPSGEPKQELGGVGVGWVAAAAALSTTALEALRTEVERVSSKPRSHFTQRNQNKLDAGFTGAAQPERPGPTLPSCAACGGDSRLMPVCQKCYSVVGGFKDAVAPQSAPGPQWISVENPPDSPREVLVTSRSMNVYLLASYHAAEKLWLDDDGEPCVPTDWCERPSLGSVAPPEAEREAPAPHTVGDILQLHHQWVTQEDLSHEEVQVKLKAALDTLATKATAISVAEAPAQTAGTDSEPYEATQALILKHWPTRPEPESIALMLEGLLLEPHGGAHCVLCGGRINCADCRPSVPTGHKEGCRIPEFLDFYLPELSSAASSPVCPTECPRCENGPENPSPGPAAPMQELVKFIAENADFGPLMPNDIEGIAQLMQKWAAIRAKAPAGKEQK
jgi:hypothetical protein